MRNRLRSLAVATFFGLGVAAPQHYAYAAPEQPAAATGATQRTEPTTLAGLSLARRTDVSYMTSPKTWSKEVIGFLLVDRFNRGRATTADNKKTQPTDPKGWHGGNITGITEKLDYLQGLGHTTIWASPVLNNNGEAGQYHGYGIFDFLDTEKHFGTMEDYVTLVKEAHKRGMRVLMDIVVNHTGRDFEYKEADNFVGRKLPVDESSRRKLTPEFPPNSMSEFGTVNNWGDPFQVTNGDFVDGGFRHFDLSNKETQDAFIKIYKHLIARTGVDGFRVDTVKHVFPDFWPRFNREIKEYAAGLGMNNFGTFAEYFAASPDDMARLTSPVEGDFHTIDPKGKNLGFTSALNFSSHFGEIDALRGTAPTRRIRDARDALAGTLTPSQLNRAGRFPDNHDVPRFLSGDGKIGNLKVSLARAFFGAGIPVIYYGTEQGVREMPGDVDPNNSGLLGRPDLFASPFKSPGAPRTSSLNPNAPLYRLHRLYADVRKTYEPLSQGTPYERWSDPNGPGIYVESRVHDGKEVVVVYNTSGQTRKVDNVWVDHDIWQKHVWPGGQGASKSAKLIDALHPNYSAQVASVGDGQSYQGAQVANVEVPAYGVRVLVSEHDYVPTPLRNFNDDGLVRPWQGVTARTAARMSSLPSLDNAEIAPPGQKGFRPAASPSRSAQPARTTKRAPPSISAAQTHP